MRLDQIELLLGAGDIKQAIISKAVMQDNKWMVQLERKSSGEMIPLTARRSNIRYFASTDSALKVLNELGMKTAYIDWR